MGIREDFSQNRGATVESINALPIFKFKLKNNENGDDQDVNAAIDEGGILACSHFFHVMCVDKWLKINATCPLCKNEVGTSNGGSPSAWNSST